MFIFNWVFDKLGYVPKIKVDAGVVAAWPFPAIEKPKKQVKKPAVIAKKVALKKATTRKPKAK